ncbi:MAG: ribonuclease Y [Acidobacteria bacterium]|nr:MAG: ribonuclease Y [Acidobacteriota bacterium]
MARGFFFGAAIAAAAFVIAYLIARSRASGGPAQSNLEGQSPNPSPAAVAAIQQAEAVLNARHAEIQNEHNELQAERHQLQAERSELQAEREKLQAERLQLQEDRGKLYQSAEVQVAEIRRQASERSDELHRAEERLDRLQGAFEHREKELSEREAIAAARIREIEEKRIQWDHALEVQQENLTRIAGMTTAEAKQQVLESVRSEAKRDAMQYIRELEHKAKEEADKRARKIVSLSIQRIASETVAEATISVVAIPSEEMKGRLIGKEGRNIRSFEVVTGVNLIIDDTPDTVLLSSFDPVRREMARVTLARLIEDGRIHPARIEEVFASAQEAVEIEAREAGEEAVLEVGISNAHPELIRALGKLKFRTSYGQNVLAHLVESAHIAGMMASELGIDASTVKRGALLHDIGKAMTHEVGGSHAIIGAELARRLGESAAVCHVIESHHNEVEQRTVEAVLGQAADQLSGARPGARREDMARHIQHLEQLEAICTAHSGVEKAFAMRAGRELRVMVDPDGLDDVGTQVLARDIAKEIESEMQFPGQIRVTVIRETRATEYAK